MINQVTFAGNLGVDPEVRFTNSGQAVANLRIASTEKWTDKQGQKQERTEWAKVTVWGKQAETCGEYLRKGDKALVTGRLETKQWEKDGVKQYSTEIVADRVIFLSKPAGKKDSASATADSADIPF